MEDHDQRFKALLREFLPDFFELFFPDWAALFDFSRAEFLEQEEFPDPPAGQRRVLDLVVKLPARAPLPVEPPVPGDVWIRLIHVEIEASDSVAQLRARMHRYYTYLRDRHGLPVLPVALYLRVGVEGLGEDVYRESFGSLQVLSFRYLYVGLPKLDAVQYFSRGNPLGAALTALMRLPTEQRALF